jgi:8-oxo-dGTP pyrophosphatase MutT (NUDIX family)
LPVVARDERTPLRAVHRLAARVLLLDPTDRVLLSHDVLEGQDYWATPGGGVEQDETPEQAALREVAEETGLTDVELGPLVLRHRFRAQMFGVDLHQRELIFLGRTAGGEIDTSGLIGLEREFMTGFHWWTRPELTKTREVILPVRLAALVAHVLDHGPPEQPWSSHE